MFWNKKEERKSLPDLPPLKSPFSQELSPQLNQEDHEIKSDEKEEKHSLPSFPDSPIDKGFSQAAIKEAVTEEEPGIDNDMIPPKMQGQKMFKNEDIQEKIIESKDSDDSDANPYISSITTVPKTTSSIPAPPPKEPEVPKITEPAEIPLKTNNPYLRSSTPQFPIAPPMTVQINEKPIPPQPISSENEEYAPPTRFQQQKAPTPAPIQMPMNQSQKSSDIFVKIDKFYSAKKALVSITKDVEDVDSLLKKIRETKLKEERELLNWEKQISSIKDRIQTINSSIFEKT